MINQLFKTIFIASLGWFPFIAQADIYEYIDAKGVRHYSDVPNHDGYVLILKTVTGQSVPVSKSIKSSQLNKNSATSLTSPRLLAYIEQSAKNNQIESELIYAVMHVESAFKTKAKSPKGAEGLMQLMPQTAKRFGVKNSYDPAQNIEGGARYLKELLKLFNNDISLTLAAYNAGENAVIKYGKQVPPYKETQAYVPKVLSVYEKLLKQRTVKKAI